MHTRKIASALVHIQNALADHLCNPLAPSTMITPSTKLVHPIQSISDNLESYPPRSRYVFWMERARCIAAETAASSPSNPVAQGKAFASFLVPVQGSPRMTVMATLLSRLD